MSRYASKTAVSVEKTKAEIERLLARYGADGFHSGWHKEQRKAMVAFQIGGRHIRFVLDLPSPESREIQRTPTGLARSPESRRSALEQAERQRWRALLLVVQAKLEAVESGITTFEQEFLAHMVMANGQTYGDHAIPRVVQAIEAGEVPPLMLPGGPPSPQAEA